MRHGMVMQADERVRIGLRRERGVEADELPVVEVTAVLAGDRAVEHDEHPAVVAPREVVHERRPGERAGDVRRMVVIARQAVDRRAGVRELRPEHRVPGRVVVHEVAGQQESVRVRVVAPRVRKATRQRRGGRNAANPHVRRSGEMRVRELQYSHLDPISSGSARA